jgi:phage-related protein (TIGR01555 family)
MSRLFGEQVGGLGDSNEGDLTNYYDFCVKERKMKIDHNLDRFDQIFVRSVLGVMPEGYKSEWESLWQMDDTEKATIEKTNADRDNIYLQRGVVNEGVIAADLKRRGVYPLMTSDDVKLAQELGEQMDDHEAEMRDQLENPPEPTNTPPNKKK